MESIFKRYLKIVVVTQIHNGKTIIIIIIKFAIKYKYIFLLHIISSHIEELTLVSSLKCGHSPLTKLTHVLKTPLAFTTL